MVHASRYGELAPLVTSLVPELEQATRAAADAELVSRARELLSDTCQAGYAIMARPGETGAAWIAADRAAFAAEAMHDPLIVAASRFRMAHVYLTPGQSTQAQAVAASVAEGLGQRAARETAPPALSLLGAFHLVLATAAHGTTTGAVVPVGDRQVGQGGLVSPGRVMGSSSRARHHTHRPLSRTAGAERGHSPLPGGRPGPLPLARPALTPLRASLTIHSTIAHRVR
jgi:hypothetical protein